MANKHFAVIVGARPNFVKAAAFFNEAKKHQDFKFTIIHTGQHFDDDMSKVFFDKMGIPEPDINLGINSGSFSDRLGKMVMGIRWRLQDDHFDGVIVFGDVDSSLAGALAAVQETIPLVHIEAGLRSGDRGMPEEMNRITIDHLSKLLFTTEWSASGRLSIEGILGEVWMVGNLMIESLELFWDKIEASTVVEDFGLTPRQYVVATIHRAENLSKERLEHLLSLLKQINQTIQVVFCLHPGTKKTLNEFEISLGDLTCADPQAYFDFMKLVSESKGVITDSGGIQEETSHLGIPCATLRNSTERPVTVNKGSNKLFPDGDDTSEAILAHLKRTDFGSRNILHWDSKVSQRIFEHLGALDKSVI